MGFKARCRRTKKSDIFQDLSLLGEELAGAIATTLAGQANHIVSSGYPITDIRLSSEGSRILGDIYFSGCANATSYRLIFDLHEMPEAEDLGFKSLA